MIGLSEVNLSQYSVSFPEFGRPTAFSLLQKAREISPDISGPATHVIETTKGLLTLRVFPPIEFQSKKGED